MSLLFEYVMSLESSVETSKVQNLDQRSFYLEFGLHRFNTNDKCNHNGGNNCLIFEIENNLLVQEHGRGGKWLNIILYNCTGQGEDHVEVNFGGLGGVGHLYRLEFYKNPLDLAQTVSLRAYMDGKLFRNYHFTNNVRFCPGVLNFKTNDQDLASDPGRPNSVMGRFYTGSIDEASPCENCNPTTQDCMFAHAREITATGEYNELGYCECKPGYVVQESSFDFHGGENAWRNYDCKFDGDGTSTTLYNTDTIRLPVVESYGHIPKPKDKSTTVSFFGQNLGHFKFQEFLASKMAKILLYQFCDHFWSEKGVVSRIYSGF